MRIIRPELRTEFQGAGYCEYCRKRVRAREAAHVFAKGQGGGRTLDIRINLIALCAAFSGGDACHRRSHDGHEPTQNDLLLVVATREGCLQDDIIGVVHWLRRLDKDASAARIRAALAELRGGARRLARRELAEAGVLA